MGRHAKVPPVIPLRVASSHFRASVEWVGVRLATRLGPLPQRRRARTTHNVARTKTEADETMVISNHPVVVGSSEEAMAIAAKLTAPSLRDSLDRRLAAVGGVRRRQMTTEEGRAAVESCLQGLDLRGQAAYGPSGRMLDLDELHRDLQMPTVVEDVVRSGS